MKLTQIFPEILLYPPRPLAARCVKSSPPPSRRNLQTNIQTRRFTLAVYPSHRPSSLGCSSACRLHGTFQSYFQIPCLFLLLFTTPTATFHVFASPL